MSAERHIFAIGLLENNAYRSINQNVRSSTMPKYWPPFGEILMCPSDESGADPLPKLLVQTMKYLPSINYITRLTPKASSDLKSMVAKSRGWFHSTRPSLLNSSNCLSI